MIAVQDASNRPGHAQGSFFFEASPSRSAPRPATPSPAPVTAEPVTANSRPRVDVLADRIAAVLVHHEPGWRLPRHTALARRYGATIGEIEPAIEELISRQLVRRLPDGQLYRASPAEYLIPLDGIPGITAYVDPMGGEITCRSRHVSWRRAPEDISRTLGITPREAVCVLRLMWTATGEPAALSTTYLAAHLAEWFTRTQHLAAEATYGILPMVPPQTGDDTWEPVPGPQCQPRAVFVEMQAPPPSAARTLRIAAGSPAVLITIRFHDIQQDKSAAITAAALRPDLFRVVLQAPQSPLHPPGDRNPREAWTYLADGEDAG
jgi:DNA-binding GntR family transcriptional regulator